MSQPSALHDSLQQAIVNRAKRGFTIFHVDNPLPSSAPDFFSNSHLSLPIDGSVKEIFLRKVQAAAPDRLFGSTGCRLATGHSMEFKALENAFKQFLGAPSALFFGSGFNANLAFVAYVPQKNDIIIHDEFIHTSSREGIRLSSHTSYRFAHNSIASFKECLLGVLQKHPQITQGSSTVFVLLESLYSMDGDFSPLTEIVELVETLVPPGHAHIVVDEAHTSGITGPNGTGYVSLLGLNDSYQSPYVWRRVGVLRRSRSHFTAIVLTSPIVRDYLINFAKNVMFSTSMPYTDIYALGACLAVVSSPRGQELRDTLHRLSRYAREKLSNALKNVPKTILALNDYGTTVLDRGFCSPIIPVFTPRVSSLTEYLLQKGYCPSALTYPIVGRPRIRIVIHAFNTEQEIDGLVDELLAWAGGQDRSLSLAGGQSGSARVTRGIGCEIQAIAASTFCSRYEA